MSWPPSGAAVCARRAAAGRGGGSAGGCADRRLVAVVVVRGDWDAGHLSMSSNPPTMRERRSLMCRGLGKLGHVECEGFAECGGGNLAADLRLIGS